MPKIVSINITNKSNETTYYVNQAYLEKNKGIVNDRYYNRFKEKKEQVTLIGIENIKLFNHKIGKTIEAKDFRRNIITSEVDLEKLVNKKIKINNVKLLIHEICQPCKYLQKKLNSNNLVKLLINKSGVRAEILSSGFIKINNQINLI